MRLAFPAQNFVIYGALTMRHGFWRTFHSDPFNTVSCEVPATPFVVRETRKQDEHRSQCAGICNACLPQFFCAADHGEL